MFPLGPFASVGGHSNWRWGGRARVGMRELLHEAIKYDGPIWVDTAVREIVGASAEKRGEGQTQFVFVEDLALPCKGKGWRIASMWSGTLNPTRRRDCKDLMRALTDWRSQVDDHEGYGQLARAPPWQTP